MAKDIFNDENTFKHNVVESSNTGDDLINKMSDNIMYGTIWNSFSGLPLGLEIKTPQNFNLDLSGQNVNNDKIKNTYLYLASLKPAVTFAGGNMLFSEGFENGVHGARIAVEVLKCAKKEDSLHKHNGMCEKTEVIFIPRSEVDDYLNGQT